MQLPKPDFRDDGDEDLLVYIGWKGDQPEQAKAACGEFYKRNVRYVFFILKKVYGHVLNAEQLQDLVTDIFLRAFDRASTYTPRGDKDRKRQERCARAWLGTVAINLCRDFFRDPDTQLVLIDDYSDVSQVPSRSVEKQDVPVSGDLACVHEAMEALSERERTIVRVTMQYWKMGEQHQRLPNAVADELARTFDITSENLRKIRERAMQKIRASVEACQKHRLQGAHP